MSIADILREHEAQLTLVENRIWLLHKHLGVPAYDFDFDLNLDCSHPYELPDGDLAIARVGAFRNYDGLYSALVEKGLNLANTPAQYLQATDLTRWYEILEDLTPRSVWWSKIPSAADVEEHFSWPVFVKGERQTDRHNASSIVRSPREFETLMTHWRTIPLLSWQRVVVREFVELRPVVGDTGVKVPASFEFRTFWWKGDLVGAGPYWSEFAEYDWTSAERRDGIDVARQAAQRVDVDFLVIDIAQSAAGEWIVIELNEAQESGYAGVPRLPLWRAILSVTQQTQ